MNKLGYFLIPLFTLALLSACSSAPEVTSDVFDDTAAAVEDVVENTPEAVVEIFEDAMEQDDDNDDSMMEEDNNDVMMDDDEVEEINTDLNEPTPTPPTTMDSNYDLGTYDGALLTGKKTVVIATRLGDITVEIDADIAPLAATNFIVHAQNGYYNDVIFHRVIPEFMIQGGDPQGIGVGGESIYGRDFEDEPNDEQMVRGVLAMANRGPNTNGSQFFITQADAPWLTGNHTIFGKVTDGMDVVDAIVAEDRDARDKPTEEISMQVAVK